MPRWATITGSGLHTRHTPLCATANCRHPFLVELVSDLLVSPSPRTHTNYSRRKFWICTHNGRTASFSTKISHPLKSSARQLAMQSSLRRIKSVNQGVAFPTQRNSTAATEDLRNHMMVFSRRSITLKTNLHCASAPSTDGPTTLTICHFFIGRPR